MDTRNAISSAFASLINAADPVEYDASWTNGTGYFDGMSRDQKLVAAGKMVRTNSPDGRIILAIPYDGHRMFVINQRYTDNQHFIVQTLVNLDPEEVDTSADGFDFSIFREHASGIFDPNGALFLKALQKAGIVFS